MKTNQLHSWSLSVEQAKAIQKNLSAWIVNDGVPVKPKTIARVEVHPSGDNSESGENFDGEPKTQSETASVTLYSAQDLSILERKHAIKNTAFPRIPGMLSFRKAPAAVAALEKLPKTPDLIICDGRGKTGEDSFGLAAHIGLITNLPTIGIRAPRARDNSNHLGNDRGQWISVGENSYDQSVVLRALTALDPILVSPAHKISQKEAIAQILHFFPNSMPSRQYLEFLYPSKTNPTPSIPLLQVIAKQG
ncbi:MAG: endonuclease V [Pseudomonadales bacterium]|nr:endonuclease V [Pseudomonadales bacterium]